MTSNQKASFKLNVAT